MQRAVDFVADELPSVAWFGPDQSAPNACRLCESSVVDPNRFRVSFRSHQTHVDSLVLHRDVTTRKKIVVSCVFH
jgi:hypothetical protein